MSSLLVLVCIVVCTGTFYATPVSPSGSLFSKDGVEVTLKGEARMITGAWTVAVVLTPPTTPRLKPYIAALDEFFAQAVENDMASFLDEWGPRLNRVRKLLAHPHPTQHIKPVTSPYKQRRSKRGLFDFVGSLSRTLFGTATVADVNSLKDVVNRLIADRSALSHEVSDLISVVNTSRQYIQTNADHIFQLQNHTKTLFEHVLKNEKTLHHLGRRLNQVQAAQSVDRALGQLETVAQDYVRSVHFFHQQKLQLERGFLTEDILSEVDLSEVLQKMADKQHFPLPLHWYYEYVTVEPMWEDREHLTFRTILPGVHRDTYLRYHLRYFPVPFDVDHLRQVVGRPDIALNTYTSEAFVPTNCMGKKPAVCFPTLEEIATSCETALLACVATPPCRIRVSPRSDLTTAVYPSLAVGGKAVVIPYTVPGFATLHCTGEAPTPLTLDGPSSVYVPPSCILQGRGWRLKGIELGVANVHYDSVEPVSLKPINMSWPDKVHPAIIANLTWVPHVEVPLLQVRKWNTSAWTGSAGFWMSLDMSDYLSGSLSSASLIISMILFIVNIYFLCKRSAARKCEIPPLHSPPPYNPLPPFQHPILPSIPQHTTVVNQIPPPQATPQVTSLLPPISLTESNIATLTGRFTPGTSNRNPYAAIRRILDEMGQN